MLLDFVRTHFQCKVGEGGTIRVWGTVRINTVISKKFISDEVPTFLRVFMILEILFASC